jgi:Tol biopolymer transport system component
MRHLSATMTAKNTLWMSVALAAGIVAAFLVVVVATPTKPAEAAFPGNNGKIVFVNLFGPGPDDDEIVTMKANGDNKTKLTNNRVSDGNPAFSPNGKKIAFESLRDGNLDIYTMNANGTDKKRVTRSKSLDFDPAWSPDGNKIAFVRSSTHAGGPFDIYVINKDGTGLTRLTTSPRSEIDPAWSPDGTRIAFERGSLSGDQASFPKIYVMKAAPQSATNRPKRLTTSERFTGESSPSWSPNGTRIAFSSSSCGDCFVDLYSIRADGSDLIQLTGDHTTTHGFSPAWSPDGTKITFAGFRENVDTLGIYVMKAKPESETNSPKRLTGTRKPSKEPDWQPLR